jgi:hypothetical protein
MQLFYNNDTFRAFICPDPICPTSPARPIGSLQQNISNLSLARASRPPLFSLFLSRMPLALLPLSLRCRRASRCAGSSLPPLFSLSCALVLLPLLSLSLQCGQASPTQWRSASAWPQPEQAMTWWPERPSTRWPSHGRTSTVGLAQVLPTNLALLSQSCGRCLLVASCRAAAYKRRRAVASGELYTPMSLHFVQAASRCCA